MDESDTSIPRARTRRRHWFSWVWLIPLGAAAIVIWLALRALADRGPLISISFSEAQGIQAGDTKIRHKDVEIGTVESVNLTPDMSRVIVRARMRRSATAHLTTSTRFWIVRPRVGVGGISGLSTLVSGAYIEMYPADGEPQRDFVGLDEPPVLTPDTPGRSFTLQTDDLGSLSGGSSISYRGVPVGEIEGYALAADGKLINVYAFVRAPYEDLVTVQSRFWNSDGIDVSVGAQGVRFRASTWQQLISGGVSFDSPPASASNGPSAAGSVFRLYDNQDGAQSDPRGQTLVYSVHFTGAAGGLQVGTAVQLQGAEIGRITQAQLQYDDATRRVLMHATFVIDPTRVQIVHRRAAQQADASSALAARLQQLVASGLRAHLTSANFITGVKVISLDTMADAPAARIAQVDGIAEFPSAPATDLGDILNSAQQLLHHIDAATAGPALGHAITEFDRTLTNLDHITAEVEPQIKPLLDSLREAAENAQRTLQSANSVLGNTAASGADLPQLIRELTDAARSLRDLTDYLNRHPEALLRGRKADKQ